MKTIENQFLIKELVELLKEIGFDAPFLEGYEVLLYQQVFDWFREVKKLDSYIQPNLGQYSINIVDSKGRRTTNPNLFYDYNVAKQYLIYDLIKMVKDENKGVAVREINKAFSILADLELNLPSLEDLEENEKDHIGETIHYLRTYLINCKIMRDE